MGNDDAIACELVRLRFLKIGVQVQIVRISNDEFAVIGDDANVTAAASYVKTFGTGCVGDKQQGDGGMVAAIIRRPAK